MTSISVTSASPMNFTGSSSKRQTRRWSHDEHAKFLRGLEMFPHGPWSRIAAVVGTRTTRQTMTHAQKYRDRMVRRADEVHALRGTLGQSGAPTSIDLLQETVRELPTKAPTASRPQRYASSDEDLMEEIGLSGVAADLDELDMRILLSLLSPETDSHTTTTMVDYANLGSTTETTSHELDHSIWSLLVGVPGDLTQFANIL